MSGNELPKIAAGVISLALVIGCAPSDYSPTPSPATEAATIPTAISEPTQTPTRTPHPTDVPTRTPQPTSTIGPPEIPLSEDEPWLIFMAAVSPETSDGSPSPYLWAMNPDGTGLTLLDTAPVKTYMIQPTDLIENQSTIVYVTGTSWDSGDYTLKMITLPDQITSTITPLVGEEGADNTDILYDILRLSTEWFLWSPDGSKLAFVGLLNSKTVDVYIYDFISKKLTCLTDTTNTELIDYDDSDESGFYDDWANSCCLRWSPDGRYVIYDIFPSTVMGQPIHTGLGAARVDGGRVMRLIDMDAHHSVYGWYGPNEILLQDRGLRDDEPDSGIYAFNLDTGKATLIFDDEVTTAAYAEKYNTWLIVQSPDQPLILYRDGKRREIPNPGIDWRISWLDSEGLFRGVVGHGEMAKTYTITLDGAISERVDTSDSDSIPTDWQGEFSPWRLVSPDETLWAWADTFYLYPGILDYDITSALWVGAPYVEPKLIFATDNDTDSVKPDDLLLYNIVWSPDSKRLIYLTNQGLYVAERPDFEPVLVAELYGIPWDYWRMTWMRHE